MGADSDAVSEGRKYLKYVALSRNIYNYPIVILIVPPFHLIWSYLFKIHAVWVFIPYVIRPISIWSCSCFHFFFLPDLFWRSSRCCICYCPCSLFSCFKISSSQNINQNWENVGINNCLKQTWCIIKKVLLDMPTKQSQSLYLSTWSVPLQSA